MLWGLITPADACRCRGEGAYLRWAPGAHTVASGQGWRLGRRRGCVTAGAYAHARGSTGGGLDRHRAVRMVRWPGGSTLPDRYTYAASTMLLSFAWEDLWMWRFRRAGSRVAWAGTCRLTFACERSTMRRQSRVGADATADPPSAGCAVREEEGGASVPRGLGEDSNPSSCGTTRVAFNWRGQPGGTVHKPSRRRSTVSFLKRVFLAGEPGPRTAGTRNGASGARIPM
jgi:hypothetical protein